VLSHPGREQDFEKGSFSFFFIPGNMWDSGGVGPSSEAGEEEGGGGEETEREREISTSGAEDDFEIGCLSPE